MNCRNLLAFTLATTVYAAPLTPTLTVDAGTDSYNVSLVYSSLINLAIGTRDHQTQVSVVMGAGPGDFDAVWFTLNAKNLTDAPLPFSFDFRRDLPSPAAYRIMHAAIFVTLVDGGTVGVDLVHLDPCGLLRIGAHPDLGGDRVYGYLNENDDFYDALRPCPGDFADLNKHGMQVRVSFSLSAHDEVTMTGFVHLPEPRTVSLATAALAVLLLRRKTQKRRKPQFKL